MNLVICYNKESINNPSYLLDQDFNVIQTFSSTYDNKGSEYLQNIKHLIKNGINIIITNSLEEGIKIIKNKFK